MKELIVITGAGVNARDLYIFLGIKHRFRDWIGNSIRDYGFKEGEDFRYFFSTSESGRKVKEYAISIDMAKELSMVSKTKKGKQARRYFIKCEEVAKKIYAETLTARIRGKEARRTLTDEIRDTGENERMHGHGYATYTRLAYKFTGIQKGDRDKLSPEDLDRLENVELLMKGYLKAGQDYQQIKDALSPLFPSSSLKV